MDKKEIQSVWNAFLEVQEAKKAPVTKKDDDGEGMDPVGKEDGDIDNDGDKDSSDEYLANRRKKVGKEIAKDKEVKEGELPPALKKNAEKKKKEGDEEEVKESEESPYPSLDKKKREKKGSNLEDAGGPAAKLKGESVEVEGELLEKQECPKCEGKGCDHCDDKGYHMVKKETYGSKKVKESNLFSDAELAAIEEKMQPNDTGGKPEGIMDKESPKSKQFAKDHEKSDKKFEDMEDQSEEDAAKAGRGVKSQAPTRRGEKRSGDLAMEKPTKAAGQ